VSFLEQVINYCTGVNYGAYRIIAEDYSFSKYLRKQFNTMRNIANMYVL